MKKEIEFLKLIVVALIIINLFVCLKSMRLEIEYNKLNKENEKLKNVLTEVEE